MRKSKAGIVALFLGTLLLCVSALQAAPQDNTNFTGTWALMMAPPPDGGGGQGAGGGQGGGGEQGGGGRRGGGGGGRDQTLTITRDGDKYSVTHHTGRGDSTADATVSGSTISWTEERTGREGNTMKIRYQASVTGDDMKGSMSGGRFNRDFTAKRSN